MGNEVLPPFRPPRPLDAAVSAPGLCRGAASSDPPAWARGDRRPACRSRLQPLSPRVDVAVAACPVRRATLNVAEANVETCPG